MGTTGPVAEPSGPSEPVATPDGGVQDGGEPHQPCVRPAGTYQSTPSSSWSSNAAYVCTAPPSQQLAWEHVSSPVSEAVGGYTCTTSADVYSWDGCEYESVTSCTDGSSVRLVCELSPNAATLDCTSYTDLVATTCTTPIRMERTDCPSPLVLELDDVCHAGCTSGYRWNGSACEDVDECVGLRAPCGDHGACENTAGGYRCVCDPGYAGTRACVLEDPCLASGEACHIDAFCDDSEATPLCRCRSGYAGDGSTCADVDECAQGACGEHSSCTNEPGSFRCTCDEGYDWDGAACQPRDACIGAGLTCHSDAHCDESLPDCVCDEGYRGDGSVCDDIDECDETPALCGTHGVCSNTPGGYACECEPGYALAAGGECEISNYCVAVGDCAEDARCSNTANEAFVCQCNAAVPSQTCGVWADTDADNASFDRERRLGFWFVAPFDMRIVAGRVPNMIGGFNGTKQINFLRLEVVGELTGLFDHLGGGEMEDEEIVGLDILVRQGEAIGVLGYGEPEDPSNPLSGPRSLPSAVGGTHRSNFDGVIVELKPLEAEYTDLRFDGLYAWDDEPGRAPSRGVSEFMWRYP